MRRGILLALAATVAITGCAPLASPSAPPAPAPAVVRADHLHEYGLSSSTSRRPGSFATATGVPGFRSPLLAIEVFASGYINWSGGTIARHMRGLARISVGQARAAVTLLAANAAEDYELHRSGVSNAGTIEAIASVTTSHAGAYVVVTRELTTATGTTLYAGLRPAWHVALAGVTRTASGGWLVSQWQPEN